LVNQRRDHYRVDRRVSALPTPRTLYPRLSRCLGGPAPQRRPPRAGEHKRTESSALSEQKLITSKNFWQRISWLWHR